MSSDYESGTKWPREPGFNGASLLAAIQRGDHEGEVQRLAAIEPGVARRFVAVVQIVLDYLVAPADALGHVVAGELDVDAPRMGAEPAVHLEEAGDLVEDVVQPAGLVSVGRLERVAVHRVADPYDRRPVLGDPLHQGRQNLADLAGAQPGDERQPARFATRVESFDERNGVVR